MSELRDLLHRTADHAADFLDSLDDRPVFPRISPDEMRARLDMPLPDEPVDPSRVVEEFAEACDPGLVAMPSGRYFGFVIGGGVPAALTADWLTSAWDQNADLYVAGPAASVVEDVARGWLCDLLALPPNASIGFVTGTQMAHVTGLAAARFEMLRRAGWDVGRDGLSGAPRLRWRASRRRLRNRRPTRRLGRRTPPAAGRARPTATPRSR